MGGVGARISNVCTGLGCVGARISEGCTSMHILSLAKNIFWLDHISLSLVKNIFWLKHTHTQTLTPCNETVDTVCSLCNPTSFSANGMDCVDTPPYGFKVIFLFLLRKSSEI